VGNENISIILNTGRGERKRNIHEYNVFFKEEIQIKQTCFKKMLPPAGTGFLLH
jgi:hypothetical protein